MIDFWISFAGALAAGMLGALTGLGGGVVIIPMLTLGLGVPMHYAIGASLMAVIGTSSGAATGFLKEGFTNIRVGIFLEIATTIGAIVGALIAGWLPANTIGIAFGLLLMVTAVLNLRNKGDHRLERVPKSWSERLKLYGTYPLGEEMLAYGSTRSLGGFLMMGFAGMMSGLLGIGGGALKVLAMDNLMKLPFKVSTATSNFMIGVTAATGALIYFQRGEIIPYIAAPVMLGATIGSFVGAKIFTKAKTPLLKMIFGVVVAILSIYMIYNGVTGKFE